MEPTQKSDVVPASEGFRAGAPPRRPRLRRVIVATIGVGSLAFIVAACGSSKGREAISESDAAPSLPTEGFDASDSGDLTDPSRDPITCEEAATMKTYVGCDYWPTVTGNVVADVFDWTAPASGVDVVVSSFGLKTFNRPQLARLAERVARMLRPGGTCAFIEISMPPAALLRVPYRFYLKFVIPVLGWVLLGNPDCYRMLGIYTEAFGDSAYFAACLREAGLDVVETSHFFGCATGVRGRKRQDEETR